MDYRNLFQKLEQHLGRIERSDDLLSTLAAMLERLVIDFRDDLGLAGGRFYVRDGDDFVVHSEYPEGQGHLGFRIPVSYPPVQEIPEQQAAEVRALLESRIAGAPSD